ncbi:MAG: hypothetical protein ACFFD4_14695 [Candidatus Odinarchaeota archaeon]
MSGTNTNRSGSEVIDDYILIYSGASSFLLLNLGLLLLFSDYAAPFIEGIMKIPLTDYFDVDIVLSYFLLISFFVFPVLVMVFVKVKECKPPFIAFSTGFVLSFVILISFLAIIYLDSPLSLEDSLNEDIVVLLISSICTIGSDTGGIIGLIILREIANPDDSSVSRYSGKDQIQHQETRSINRINPTSAGNSRSMGVKRPGTNLVRSVSAKRSNISLVDQLKGNLPTSDSDRPLDDFYSPRVTPYLLLSRDDSIRLRRYRSAYRNGHDAVHRQESSAFDDEIAFRWLNSYSKPSLLDSDSIYDRNPAPITLKTASMFIVKPSDTCRCCGQRLQPSAENCPLCGTDRNSCPICLRNINYADESTACPTCRTEFHVSHLKDALKAIKKCPICHSPQNEERKPKNQVFDPFVDNLIRIKLSS